MRGLRRLWMAATAAAALVLGLGAPAVAAPATTLVNPVSAGFADTFADPSVVRGDGVWYAYATSDPLRSGQAPTLIPQARSTDLVHWTSAGPAFTEATRPSWATPTAALWAPDIRRIGNRWLLYYVVTDTTLNADPGTSAVGVATAPTPTGPWSDSGCPLVGPRPAPGGGFLWTFDPA